MYRCLGSRATFVAPWYCASLARAHTDKDTATGNIVARCRKKAVFDVPDEYGASGSRRVHRHAEILVGVQARQHCPLTCSDTHLGEPKRLPTGPHAANRHPPNTRLPVQLERGIPRSAEGDATEVALHTRYQKMYSPLACIAYYLCNRGDPPPPTHPAPNTPRPPIQLEGCSSAVTPLRATSGGHTRTSI
jgi:hypothetical protein